MKGIILAGGAGSRLFPITANISKQLLPVYNKPMIYYPLSTLMLANIREILIITTPRDKTLFQGMLGDGRQWGLNIEYKIQDNPNGIAEAFIIGENFIGNDSVSLVLGDNILFGHNLQNSLEKFSNLKDGAAVFAYQVKDPERYGVVEFNKFNNVLSIEEKPENPKSNYAVIGLYFYSNSVIEIAKSIKPSNRGELEITDINKVYLNSNSLQVEGLGRGSAWFDAGTFDSLMDASQFIQTIENRQGLQIACLEEIALRKNWISKNDVLAISKNLKNSYGSYLESLVR